jgi:hypothetical protein
MRAVLASAVEPEETSFEKTLHINDAEPVLSGAIAGEFAPLSQSVEADVIMMQTGEFFHP